MHDGLGGLSKPFFFPSTFPFHKGCGEIWLQTEPNRTDSTIKDPLPNVLFVFSGYRQ